MAGTGMRQKKDTQPEIVPTIEAYSVVQGWLKQMTGWKEEDEVEPADEPELRPARLGLGAKYLPHSQVAASMTSLEKKLRARLIPGRQKKRGEEDDGEEEEEETVRGGRPFSSKKNKSRSGNSSGKCMEEKSVGMAAVAGIFNGESDDDEEEEDSRAGSFKRKRDAVPSAAASQSLQHPSESGSVKKRKKKKRKKSAAAPERSYDKLQAAILGSERHVAAAGWSWAWHHVTFADSEFQLPGDREALTSPCAVPRVKILA
eukprot:jgi/Mesen1/10204/ME000766S09570